MLLHLALYETYRLILVHLTVCETALTKGVFFPLNLTFLRYCRYVTQVTAGI